MEKHLFYILPREHEKNGWKEQTKNVHRLPKILIVIVNRLSLMELFDCHSIITITLSNGYYAFQLSAKII